MLLKRLKKLYRPRHVICDPKVTGPDGYHLIRMRNGMAVALHHKKQPLIRNKRGLWMFSSWDAPEVIRAKEFFENKYGNLRQPKSQTYQH